MLGTGDAVARDLENWRSGRYQRRQLPERAAPGSRLRGCAPSTCAARLPSRDSHPPCSPASARPSAGESKASYHQHRRGYAPCARTAKPAAGLRGCGRCTARMGLHAADRRLRCHHCGDEAAVPLGCPVCGNVDLKPMGRGTQRVEETLAARFPGARIVRIDRDSARRRAELSRTLEGIRRGEGDILVGTQLLAKGHDFPALTLVGVLNARRAGVQRLSRAERCSRCSRRSPDAPDAQPPGRCWCRRAIPTIRCARRWCGTTSRFTRRAARGEPHRRLSALRVRSGAEGEARS